MKVSSFFGGVMLGAVTGMAADMLLRPKAQPKTDAGRKMQTVTNAVDSAATKAAKAVQQMK